MNTQQPVDEMIDLDAFDAEPVELPATQIAYAGSDGRELVRWGAPGVTAQRLAASLPEGTVWREVTREEGEAIVAFVPLDEARTRKLADIDRTTAAAILAGVEFALQGVAYRFSYDERDQQNFADAANQVLLARLENRQPASVTWTGYVDDAQQNLTIPADTFLALYTAVVSHKNACLEEGRIRKEAVRAAIDADALAAI